MTDRPSDDLKEQRVRARLAWNGWPDNAESRKIIAEHEARDPFSACAWDRVVTALTTTPEPCCETDDDGVPKCDGTCLTEAERIEAGIATGNEKTREP